MRALSKAINRVRYWIVRHEMWALEIARDAPILSIFPIATLFLWLFVPTIPLASIAMWSIVNDYPIGLLVVSVPAMVLVVAIGIWMFEWYLIGLTLFFGGKSMAAKKAKDLDLQRAFLARNRERLQQSGTDL